MIAIHNSHYGYHPRWIDYCNKKRIPYKLVNCYDNNIIEQLIGCSSLMWHHHHTNSKDILFAKQLLFSLEQSGFAVFPNFNTLWHFDDKVGQKYLLEALDVPHVPTHVFYSRKEAIAWTEQVKFPKVFKLRGGAGSANVKLAKTKSEALHLIKRAFGKGFKQYEPLTNLTERWRKYRLGETSFWNVLKGVLRIFHEPEYSKIVGYQQGYIYFQDFIPNNDFDIRIIVINNKAFGLKRMVRKGDFRASGSGSFKVAREEFDERCIKAAFETSRKIRSQCLAYDFVFDEHNVPLLIEISYGFSVEAYDNCPGYWDDQLNWYDNSFNPQEWMVEAVVKVV